MGSDRSNPGPARRVNQLSPFVLSVAGRRLAESKYMLDALRLRSPRELRSVRTTVGKSARTGERRP